MDNKSNNTNNKETINNIQSYIDKANSIAIVPSKINGADAYSAGCGLYKSLKILDKKVSFIHTHKVPEGCEHLLTQEELINDIFERELHVSIDYSQTPAARVHYSTENDVLHLKVKPIDKNFDLSRVKATIKGFNFDLVIVIGATELEDLGQIYHELKESFNLSSIINIDHSSLNKHYGKVNLIDNTKDSISTLMLQTISKLNYPLTDNIAKCFLTGLIAKNQIN